MLQAGGWPEKVYKRIKPQKNGGAWRLHEVASESIKAKQKMLILNVLDNYTTLPELGELYKERRKNIAVVD